MSVAEDKFDQRIAMSLLEKLQNYNQVHKGVLIERRYERLSRLNFNCKIA